MRITIIGNTGKVGSELVSVLQFTHQIDTINRIDCDLEKEPEKVGRLIQIRKPDIVINATAKNGMEQCAADPMAALEVNAVAPAIMANACKNIGAFFIHFSTDYVFSGKQGGLYETDPLKPSGQYGWSKARGEEMVQFVGDKWAIFRLSSVYGRQWSGPVDPINQVLQGKGTKENPIKVLHQFCCPTSSRTIARAINEVIASGIPIRGIYHLATSRGVWKKEYAQHITKAVFQRDFVVEEGTLAVPRPVDTMLMTDKFQKVFGGLPHWRTDFDAMRSFMPKIPELVKLAAN